MIVSSPLPLPPPLPFVRPQVPFSLPAGWGILFTAFSNVFIKWCRFDHIALQIIKLNSIINDTSPKPRFYVRRLEGFQVERSNGYALRVPAGTLFQFFGHANYFGSLPLVTRFSRFFPRSLEFCVLSRFDHAILLMSSHKRQIPLSPDFLLLLELSIRLIRHFNIIIISLSSITHVALRISSFYLFLRLQYLPRVCNTNKCVRLHSTLSFP